MTALRHLVLGLLVWTLIIPTFTLDAEAIDSSPRVADGVFSEYPGPVLDGVLEDKLADAGPMESLEALVQFHDSVTDTDLALTVNPSLQEKKIAQPIAGRIQVISET